MDEEQDEERLFAYGTLQSEAVQLATFGRVLKGRADSLAGHRVVMIHGNDQEFVSKSGGAERNNGSAEQRNLQFTGDEADSVEGTVLQLNAAELKQADAYEPEGYDACWCNSNPESRHGFTSSVSQAEIFASNNCHLRKQQLPYSVSSNCHLRSSNCHIQSRYNYNRSLHTNPVDCYLDERTRG